MTTATQTKKALAERLVNAVATEDDETMFEAEGAISDLLLISLDDTEMDLTPKAVELIEKWVSRTLGRKWEYNIA